MSRIAPTFQRLAAAKRAALIPYITAGYPDMATTLPLMNALVAAGGDIIEVGVPFSDPMADGPVIQKACCRALEQGATLRDVLDTVAQFRRENDDTPVVLMTYCNPVEAMGPARFAAAAAAAGADGVLMVDLPPEESAALARPLREHGLDAIFLLSPTTAEARMRDICAAASGFVYYVSLKGVTGAGHLNTDEVGARVRQVKQCTDLPVAVGFGVRDAAAAASVARQADGVVVGSALVDAVARQPDVRQSCAAVGALLGGMRKALDAAEAAA